MREATRRLLELGVVGGVIVLPVVTILHTMLGRGSGEGEQTAITQDAVQPAPSATPARPEPSIAGTDDQHEAIGVLYGKGAVAVDKLAVDKGYVYRGGEHIKTDANASGILQLGKNGAMLICPNSQMNVQKDGDAYQLNIDKGQVRFVFPQESTFQVNMKNKAVLIPAKGNQDKPSLSYAAEVSDYKDSGTVVCNLSGQISADKITDSGKQIVMQTAEVYRFGIPDKNRNNPDKQDWELIGKFKIPSDQFRLITAGSTGSDLLGNASQLCECARVYEEAYTRHVKPVQVATPIEESKPEITETEEPVIAETPSPEPVPIPEVEVTPPDDDTLAAFDPPVVLPEPWQPPPYFNPRPPASPH